jgi:uncharacterized protein YndB with AHSA1/START domain
MRYADGPTVEVELYVEAPIAEVWALVSDIELPTRFSTELLGVEWIDDVHFRGRSQHPAAGAWETTCTVLAREEPTLFAWCVGEPADPSASWRFELSPTGTGTTVRQWMRIGPAPSALTPAIEAMPDKEERIVARRLDEHRANMTANLHGIKELVEAG